MAAPTPSSTWRLSQTKFGLPSRRSFSSAAVMPSACASCFFSPASASTSLGIAQIEGVGTLVASSRPLRSTMRPRLAGISSVCA